MNTPALPSALDKLVVKDGVALGGLLEEDRALALTFVWAGLPTAVLNEREINAALQAQLAGAARCLDTDHVELRRWLVDGGWLARDGYGREYRRVPADELPPQRQGLGRELLALDTAAYTDRRRAEREEQRAARRRAFEARAGGGAA